MSDFLKIWKLEFRRQRSGLLLLVPAGAVMFFIPFFPVFRNLIFQVVVSSVFLFAASSVLCGVLTKDFQDQTFPLTMALPLSVQKIFWAKYCWSVGLLLLIAFLFLCRFTGENMIHYPAKLWLLLVCGLLALHSVVWFWGFLFRESLGGLFGLAAVPVTFIFLMPLAVILSPVQKYSEYVFQYNLWDFLRSVEVTRLFPVFAGIWLFYLLSTYFLWRKYAVFSRSFLKPLLVVFLFMILIPWSIWCGVQIRGMRSYIRLLDRYEALPEVARVGKTFPASSALWDFQKIAREKGENAALENLAEKGPHEDIMLEQKDFFQYYETGFQIRSIVFSRMSSLIRRKKFMEAAELGRVIKNIDLPVSPFFSRSTGQEKIMKELFFPDAWYPLAGEDGFYYTYPPFQGFWLSFLQNLPCTEETFPALDRMLDVFENFPDRRKIRYVPFPYYPRVLQGDCPGIREHGLKRMISISFYILRNMWTTPHFCFFRSVRTCEDSIRKQIRFVEIIRSVSDPRSADMPDLYLRNSGMTHYSEMYRIFIRVRCRLRKYFVRKNTLPEDMAVLMAADEKEWLRKRHMEISLIVYPKRMGSQEGALFLTASETGRHSKSLCRSLLEAYRQNGVYKIWKPKKIRTLR